MQRARGFTLIEVMIVVVVIAALAAIGFPSYREHIARGQRAQGQQLLSELAQRQEQFLLDRRQYAANFAALNVNKPNSLKYNDPVVTTDNAATPPSFVICMDPTNGSNLALRNDGALCINNQGQRWRQQNGGNTAFDGNGNGECEWENRSCKVTGEK